MKPVFFVSVARSVCQGLDPSPFVSAGVFFQFWGAHKGGSFDGDSASHQLIDELGIGFVDGVIGTNANWALGAKR